MKAVKSISDYESSSSSSSDSSSESNDEEFDKCSEGTSSCSGRYEGDKNIPIIDSDLYFAVKRAMGVFMVLEGKTLP